MSYVYFIQKGYGSVKIGMSSDPEKRLNQLQIGNHAKLYLLCKIPFETKEQAKYFESFLHEKFDKYRIHGEWFKRIILRKIPKRSIFFPQIFNGGTIKGYLGESNEIEINEELAHSLMHKKWPK